MRVKANTDRYNLLNFFTTGGLIVCYFVFAITFIIAYVTDKSAYVTINDYGEANFELVFIIIIGILAFYKIVNELKSMKNEQQIDKNVNQEGGEKKV